MLAYYGGVGFDALGIVDAFFADDNLVKPAGAVDTASGYLTKDFTF